MHACRHALPTLFNAVVNSAQVYLIFFFFFPYLLMMEITRFSSHKSGNLIIFKCILNDISVWFVQQNYSYISV